MSAAGTIAAERPRLADLLAHEARTPLNAIKGFAELLVAGGCGPLGAEAQGCAAEIARAARDLEVALAAAAASLADLGLAAVAPVPAATPPRGPGRRHRAPPFRTPASSSPGPSARSAPTPLGAALAGAGFASRAGDDPAFVVGTAGRWAELLALLAAHLRRHRGPGSRLEAAWRPGSAPPELVLRAAGGRSRPPGPGRGHVRLAAALAAEAGVELGLVGPAEILLRWPAATAARVPAHGTVAKPVQLLRHAPREATGDGEAATVAGGPSR